MTRGLLIGFALVTVVGAYLLAAEPTPAETRNTAQKLMTDGNFNDAYLRLSGLALDPRDDPAQVSDDLVRSIQCLLSLGRSDEVDAFREKVITAHQGNWRLLQAAAGTLINQENYGFMVAGKFYRGGRRGGDGKPVNAIERDRVRALQLMESASGQLGNEADKNALAEFWFNLARMLLDNRFGDGAWRLQSLTDLSRLPDYEDGLPAYGGEASRGAPVAKDDAPIFHKLPMSWKESQTDGQRWRWCLLQASEMSPAVARRANWTFAEFLHNQFDVQTMASFGYRFGAAEDDGKKDESGPYAVRTLKEDETIARLATGIKRFTLPEEFNFIRLFQQLAGTGKDEWAEHSVDQLAQLFENRQQYDRSAEYWKRGIQQFGPGHDHFRQDQVDQILGNWCQFDPVRTEAAGADASSLLLFRNGTHLSLTATRIDLPRLLADVKDYIKARPNQLDYDKMRVENLGYLLVQKNERKYLAAQPETSWEMDLQPLEKHFDKRVVVKAPVKKAGAYLLVAKMKDGSTSRVVLWVADTVVVKKPLDGGSLCYVADAVSGQPIPKANVEFFGFRQRWAGDNRFNIDTKDFAENTDADGMVKLSVEPQNEGNYQWLVIATTPDGRLAYQGFTGLWSGRMYDAEYKQQKTFIITDRPVYRPNQTVKFKFWVGEAKYDQEGQSPFGGRSFKVTVNDPRGEKFIEKTLTADAYGGCDGEIPLPADAMLGNYQFLVVNFGASSFRVEEYKKPEFEVKVDAPSEPVMLGEKVTAVLSAKYYFGAPVTQGKVKYKVLRSSFRKDWYPLARWDWLYEPGYWWFAADTAWYPGWNLWGCDRPIFPWFGQQFERPEVVSENEVPLGPDGTVKVEIDTALAKAVHGDTDHKYEITAEVTDESRRTIVGQGSVLVARRPFKVYAWVDRGYYTAGDTIEASFNAQTLDDKPVKGKGELKLLKVSYDGPKPVETEVQKWDLDTDDRGQAQTKIKAAGPGQFRLSFAVTDSKGHSIEGGYLFVVRGDGFDGRQFRFNDVELITDKKEYKAGDTVKLMVNTSRADAAVLLFVRPANGIYLRPTLLRLNGKSTVQEIGVVKKDMPNFFIEALTVGDGRVFDDLREVVVPPENRVINVAVTPSAEKFKPGEQARVQVRLTDDSGEPVRGSAVISVYDKAVEYISGGSNVPEIKSFFWKWRRSHQPQTESSLDRIDAPVAPDGETIMQDLGFFGSMAGNQEPADREGADASNGLGAEKGARGGDGRVRAFARMAPGAAAKPAEVDGADKQADAGEGKAAAAPANPPEPAARTNFADTAFWAAAIDTKSDGTAEVELKMPENLTTWKARVWSISSGTRVGEGTAEVVTFKNLLVRLQAPRFFVQKDEVVLSANVHNYLKTTKSVQVKLALEGPCLQTLPDASLLKTVQIPSGAEKRVDWRVKVMTAGDAVVRVAAATDEESDAVQMRFPAYIHGMLKTDSFAGALRPEATDASLTFTVPSERIINDSRLEIRYSPSVASAMVDALPYLVDYPYGCTEQTLNRFLPTVITQRVLLGMNLDLKDIQKKRANLNAQEIGDDAERAKDWKRNNPPNPGVELREPVFDVDALRAMAKEGVSKLTNMQLADGGWGWFSGFGEQSWPHTTAVVVHGLLIAKDNDVALVPGVLDRGVEWLKHYQADQIKMLKNAPHRTNPWKEHADELDAFVCMVLTDAGAPSGDMRDFLYRDRNEITVYGKALFGVALQKLGEKEKLGMILQNLSQYVVRDDANQTAYLRLPENNAWWCWYGSDTEAMATYLKLLARTDPKGELNSRLAKYLINNRKHASYWNSTRDTALCIEGLAEYIKASGEDKPDMTVSISLDGRRLKDVKINAANFFSFDNKLTLIGDAVPAGTHKIEFSKAGTGPLYFNAYVTNFTLEDPIKKAGLEINVSRKFYKLVPAAKTIKVSGARGQSLDQKVEKYDRQELPDGSMLKSGDLVEVELEIDSRNDYEYVIFEDMKAAGFEPVEVRSGYNGNDLNAYMELHDERVCFFARTLARGKHSVSYRLRAEVPGAFSALPTRASAMYAPELKANADEAKLGIQD